MPGPAQRLPARGLVLAAALLPKAATAHAFGRLYTLPVPLWLYLYGSAAALLLSFLVAAWFLARPDPAARPAPRSRWHPVPAWLPRVAGASSLSALLMCLLSGLCGNQDPNRNFSMTAFWIVFLLGASYGSALAGDWYAEANPWARLVQRAARRWPTFVDGRLPYPAALAYWPAFAAYLGLIWIELFAHLQPRGLALALLAYTALNLGGAWLFGAAHWFRHGECFAVLLRLFAMMAPVELRDGALRLRLPLAGLLEARAAHPSLLVFILLVLASTAFDGLSATRTWFQLFWSTPDGLLSHFASGPPLLAYPALLPVYQRLATLGLVLSPLLYLAAYLAAVALAQIIGRSTLPLRELALRFAYPLLPIAFAYHLSHYFTLLLTQGVRIVSLLSDPLGRGWNLFGTAELWRAPILPDMAGIWHTQVLLIVGGHVAGVVLSHCEALRIFPTRRAALLSQLPMLGLMMLFTAAGLWILAQPLQRG